MLLAGVCVCVCVRLDWGIVGCWHSYSIQYISRCIFHAHSAIDNKICSPATVSVSVLVFIFIFILCVYFVQPLFHIPLPRTLPLSRSFCLSLFCFIFFSNTVCHIHCNRPLLFPVWMTLISMSMYFCLYVCLIYGLAQIWREFHWNVERCVWHVFACV